MKLKNIIIILMVPWLLTSCELINSIGSFQPAYKLTDQNVLIDANSAESMLAGVYIGMTAQSYITEIEAVPSLWGYCCKTTPFYSTSLEAEFENNNPRLSNAVLNNLYAACYTIISRCNFIIEMLPHKQLDGLTDERKMEIIAEAHYIRALIHFQVLRLWGQFYDRNSVYGIVICTTAAHENQTYIRSNVQDSYTQILNDLNFASENGPLGKNKPYYASKEAAKALMAKVYLYMENWALAAQLAKEVIESGTYELEDFYKDIFIKQHTSSEMIFCLYKSSNEPLIGGYVYESQVAPAQSYVNVASAQADSVRYFKVVATLSDENSNSKYPISSAEGGNTIYLMRLAEVYLIAAEAEARMVSGEGVSQVAINRLNAIRMRAKLPSVAPTTKSELLKAIQIEKLLELATEGGEEWFDLVRYTILGDIANISAYKPTVTSTNLYILPYPMNSLIGNMGRVKQNPGY